MRECSCAVTKGSLHNIKGQATGFRIQRGPRVHYVKGTKREKVIAAPGRAVPLDSLPAFEMLS